MALATGFSNSWTSGEIFPDAQDRTDIQPIAKGCQLGLNTLVQVTGPLKKRRGFWDMGAVSTEAQPARLIPFRRNIDDALALLFSGDGTVTVYFANGAPTGTTFAHPYTADQLAGLRFRQVADVIYLMHSSGLQPRALERISDVSWAFNVITYPDGPWLPENIDDAFTLTFTGTQVVDGNPNPTPPAAVIMTGEVVAIVATKTLFTPDMVGDTFRVRATTGSASMRSWTPGYSVPVGWFGLSAGNIYIATTLTGAPGANTGVTNPPVQTSGLQSDGVNSWNFLHDGAGVVKITAVADATHATGTVVGTLPVGSGDATSYWAPCAYGTHNGWPRMWPSAVEERLVTGGTSGSLDLLDMTRAAGFYPSVLNYHPGQGTGAVLSTDAIRRRAGDDGSEILWSRYTNWLIVGTAAGEFLVSGGLFGDPITPAAVVVRPLSEYGSEDVYPAKGHRGIYFVCRGGQTLRKIFVDMQQALEDDDLSFLYIDPANPRTIVQLAWLPQPDFNLWVRFSDGAVAVLTIHDEQQVKGFTSQQIGDGSWAVEDMMALPGPSRLETLWLIVSRTVAGVTQRHVLMQSQRSDGLFMDVAQQYAGAPVNTLDGLTAFIGQTVRILANGAQTPDQVVAADGSVPVPAGTTAALVGQPYGVRFESLKLQTQWPIPGTSGDLKQIPGALVTVLTAGCTIGLIGSQYSEFISSRTGFATGPAKVIHDVTLGGGDDRDPRIFITEDSAYDFGLYAIKPREQSGAH